MTFFRYEKTPTLFVEKGRGCKLTVREARLVHI